MKRHGKKLFAFVRIYTTVFYQEKQERKGRKLVSNVILQRKIKVSIVIDYSSSKYNDMLYKFKENIKAIKRKIFFFLNIFDIKYCK